MTQPPKHLSKRVLISGASIAGLTLAYWLNHYGFEVVVVEKADALRLGGQNIDVKGPAWEIAGLMGIDGQILKANTTEAGIRFVNLENKELAAFPKGHPLSMTQEREILRGDLVQIIHDSINPQVAYRFGDHIESITDNKNNTKVKFAGGETEEFELVLIAEGLGSTTRRLIFKGEPQFHYLGVYTSYLTIPKAPTDTKWARWCNAPGGIVFLLRPDPYGTTRASVTLSANENAYSQLSKEEQQKALITRLQGIGWEAPRLVEELKKTEDFYFERVSQVKAPHWSKGRVAMTGDAAYCVTPIAGQGTDLAMLGPYILAGELATIDDYQQAFRRYQQRLEPYVKKVQQLPPGLPRLVYPTSKLGVKILNGFFRLFGSRPVKYLAKKLSGKKKSEKAEFPLPVYQLPAKRNKK